MLKVERSGGGRKEGRKKVDHQTLAVCNLPVYENTKSRGKGKRQNKS
jgi:hypothetical protein